MSDSHSVGPDLERHRRAAVNCFAVHVGDLMMGLPVADTQTIFKIESITPVPLSPPYIAGLTNLRGRVLTVVSLRRRLGIEDGAVRPGALAIGLQVAGEDVALIVDRVGEVIEVIPEQRMPVPPHFSREHARLTEGLYKVGDILLSVLNSHALLAVEMAAIEGSAQ